MGNVKRPEDHKPKKPEKVDIELPAPTEDDPGAKRVVPGKRVTVRGVTVDVPDEALDDFEVLDDIRAVQDDEDASRLPSLLRRLVGAGEYRRVLNDLRDPVTGRITATDGAAFVMELFEALNPSS